MPEETMKMLINVEEDETRIALIRGKQLDNLVLEQNQRTQNVGNIYCGVVTKVQPSFQAAFVDYGADRNGFLAVSDLNPRLFKETKGLKGRPNITQLLRSGERVMVQVLKDEIGHKGASLTTNISIPGRFMVFMPNSDKGGISRKIEDATHRERLKHLLKGLDSEDAGVIIRTAGVGRSLDELKRDYMNLRRVWKRIEDSFSKRPKPGLLYQEEGAVVRMLRDYFTDQISEVVIDDPNAFQQALEFFQANMPADQKRLHLYLGEHSLFSANGIESQIGALNSHRVPLPSGGSLIISPTEALVAVDVNSGRSTQERNIEETALRTNLEAADEVARQLRLRNLGGLVVIDFIDMDSPKNRQQVVTRMEEAMSRDKARWALGEISRFGLLEMSRQRIASSLATHSPTVSIANRIVRRMQDLCAERNVQEIQLSLIPDLAVHLLNEKRRRLHQLEVDFGVSVTVIPDALLDPDDVPDMEVVEVKDGDTQTTVVTAWEVEVEETHTRRRRRRRRREDLGEGEEESTSLAEAREDKQDSEEPVESEVIAVAEEEPVAESASEEDAEDKPARGRRRRGRGRRDRREEEVAESSDEISAEEETEEAEESAPSAQPVPMIRPVPSQLKLDGLIFNSIHEGVEDDGLPWSPPPVPEWRRRNQEAPINRIIFSSTHLTLDGTLPVSEEDSAGLESVAEDASAEATSEAKPTRRKRGTRKPKEAPAEKAAAASDAPVAEEIPATPEEAAAPEETAASAEEKKPAPRKRTPRKKPATSVSSEAQSSAPAEGDETSAAEGGAEPAKPAAKRSTRSSGRKTPAAKTTAKAKTSATSESAEASAEEDKAAPKAAAKPRRSRAKKPASVAEPATPEAPES
jgi:ribonuclease E